MSTEGDIGFWKWAVGIASSIVVGIASGTWAASRKVTLFESTQAKHAEAIADLKGVEAAQRVVEAAQIKHTADIVALKLAAEGHTAFCAKQKQDLLDSIRKEICNIVQLAISDLTLKQQANISNLDKNVALITQSNEQMGKHIEEIFNRLNRRDTDRQPEFDRRSHDP